jgi:hypothetical protein
MRRRKSMSWRIMKTLVALAALSVVPVPALASPPEPPPPAIAPPPPPPPEPMVTRSTVALVAAGVAVAAVAGATVFGVLALRNKSDYDAHPTYANVDYGTNDAAYADGCIALAVAAGVTSLILYVTRDTTTPTPRSAVVSASPIVTAHGGGGGFVLRF